MSYNLSCKIFSIHHGWWKWTVALKFCFKVSLSVTETKVLVQKAYGNKALNRSNDFKWYYRFWDGRELVEDDERGGCPKSTWTEVNIAAVADLVKNDHQITSRMIAKSLNIPKILKEDLGKRNLCAHFVPRSLNPEHRGDQVTSCQDFIAMADADKIFLTKLLWEMRPGVLPVTLKQSNRVLNGLLRHPLSRRHWNSKGPASRTCW